MTDSVEQFNSDVFAHNLGVVQDRIVAAGGDPNRITVVAVSKGHPAASVSAAIEAGHVDFGENYADELVEKAQQAVGRAVWHFQGRLQSNKINKLKPYVSVWQTVDSIDRAEALASRVPGTTVLVQIDSTDGHSQRAGALFGDVPGIVDRARHVGLDVVGLMTIAPLDVPDGSAGAFAFERLARLADDLSLPVRSMGMSDDLEAAVKAGTTMVRIGAALFGPRR